MLRDTILGDEALKKSKGIINTEFIQGGDHPGGREGNTVGEAHQKLLGFGEGPFPGPEGRYPHTALLFFKLYRCALYTLVYKVCFIITF